MLVKLTFAAQFVGCFSRIIEFPADVTDKQIKDSFKDNMDVPYNENCFYERLEL